MDILRFGTPAGLGLDVFGFLLVIWFGHSLFIRSVKGSPEGTNGKEDVLYISHGDVDEVRERRRRCLAYTGVVVIVLGFILQGIGWAACL